MKYPTLLLGLIFVRSLAGATEQSTPPELAIDVRSGIDQAEKSKRDHDPEYARNASHRLRLFLLARVSEEKSTDKLIKPVDAFSIAREVRRQLKAQGFREVGPNQRPEIIITVKYGRGQLMSNPYIDLDNLSVGDPRKWGQRSNLSDGDRPGTQMHAREIGREERIQAASAEKLIIQVRAWAYPPPVNPREKEHLLWMTNINIGDPDHIDLNVVAAKMLEAGAPYFDKPIAREHDVIINTTLPEGRVNVGTPQVVPPPNSQ